MRCEIRYHSKSGNTQKVADAIGAALGIQAKPISEPILEPADILFLGGALYAGNLSKELLSFIEDLSPEQVKKVVVFSTAAGDKSIRPLIQEIMRVKNIDVDEVMFQCRGKFLLANRSRPNDQDLADAAAFARGIRSAEGPV